MKIDKLKVGQTIYHIFRGKMGNTHCSTIRVMSVEVLEINLEEQKVRISYNNNHPRWITANRLNQYRLKEPKLKTLFTGAQVIDK